jgi:hypothetical protein
VAELDRRRDDEGWRETREILAEPATLLALSEGLAELGRGEVVAFSDLRRELQAARPGSD